MTPDRSLLCSIVCIGIIGLSERTVDIKDSQLHMVIDPSLTFSVNSRILLACRNGCHAISGN